MDQAARRCSGELSSLQTAELGSPPGKGTGSLRFFQSIHKLLTLLNHVLPPTASLGDHYSGVEPNARARLIAKKELAALLLLIVLITTLLGNSDRDEGSPCASISWHLLWVSPSAALFPCQPPGPGLAHRREGAVCGQPGLFQNQATII